MRKIHAPIPDEIKAAIVANIMLSKLVGIVHPRQELVQILRQFPGSEEHDIELEIVHEAERQGIALQYD